MLVPLHIRLLGGFHLQAADQTVDALGTPRLQALLTYLLLHHTMPLSRQQLAFIFWPESTEAAARTNLRSLLLQLRRALPGAERWFVLEPLVLQCRPDAPMTVDVTQFEEALARTAQAADDRARRCALGFHAQTAGFFVTLASGAAYDQYDAARVFCAGRAASR